MNLSFKLMGFIGLIDPPVFAGRDLPLDWKFIGSDFPLCSEDDYGLYSSRACPWCSGKTSSALLAQLRMTPQPTLLVHPGGAPATLAEAGHKRLLGSTLKDALCL